MSPRGFFLRYDSRRALDADHAAYLAHGGMMVPCAPEDAPNPNTEVELRIEGPDGLRFLLGGRAGHFIPGRGLMVSFEDPPLGERQALDDLVASATFRAQVEREPPEAVRPPEVGTYAATPALTEPPSTAPAGAPAPGDALADLFDEDTPVDPPFAPPAASGPPDNQPPLAAEPEALGDGPELHPDVVRRRRRPAPTAERPPTVVRTPRGGETYHVAVVKLYRISDYVETYPKFFSDAELHVEHPDAGLERGQIVRLRLTLPGHNVFEMWSVVESCHGQGFVLRVRDNDEAYRKAILYPESVAAKARREREAQGDVEATPQQILLLSEEMADDDQGKMPLRRRLARMGMDDKINLALSGNREERMALAMDSNKAVHHHLLKNAKLTLDEVAFMARLPSLNPDVLDKIAESPAYTQNPTVVRALVFNPRTPLRTSIRLLDRLPRNELMNLSKRSSMNQRLVMAAKNKLFKIK